MEKRRNINMQVRTINNDYNSNRSNSVAFKRILRNDIPEKVLESKKILTIATGPSAVGKDSVLGEIMDRFNKIVTHTTRAKREGEVEGKNYFYTTVDNFVEGIKNNEFVEYVQGFSGKYYGTKKSTIKNALDGKKPALAIVDVDGAESIRKNLKDDSEINVVSIFFQPPQENPLNVLRERMLKRGSETPESIKERLGRAEYEMSRANEFDAEIEVNSVEEGVNDILELLHLK